MKTIFLKIITITAFIGFLIPVIGFAQTPSLPHQFFGTVNFTNGAAPNGLSVEARITGAVVGSSVTADGKYGYNPYPNPENVKNLLVALDNQGVNAGKTVEFYVSGIKANETATFVNGNSSQLNLTIPVPASTPGPTPSPTPTPSGGGSTVGGGGGTPSTTYKTGDVKKDNKIDKYDFALLMANWGKTGVNASDLNNDGKVDKYDFAILMANWTI